MAEAAGVALTARLRARYLGGRAALPFRERDLPVDAEELLLHLEEASGRQSRSQLCDRVLDPDDDRRPAASSPQSGAAAGAILGDVPGRGVAASGPPVPCYHSMYVSPSYALIGEAKNRP
jgi:hypothetical protein